MHVLSAQPRPDSLRDELNQTMRQVLAETRKKLEKDYNNMQSIKATGRYVTSNRFYESIFGHLKNREDTSVKASLDCTAMLTAAKMNDLTSHLKQMKKSRIEEMWEKIEDKSTLENLHRARENLKKSLREQARNIKEAKRAQKKKTAENKRKREEKKKKVAVKPKKIKIFK